MSIQDLSGWIVVIASEEMVMDNYPVNEEVSYQAWRTYELDTFWCSIVLRAKVYIHFISM